jgi:hypothetical protein
MELNKGSSSRLLEMKSLDSGLKHESGTNS